MRKISIFIENFGKLEVEDGSTLIDIIRNLKVNRKFLCAKVGNEIKHLNYKVKNNDKIMLLDYKDKDGLRVYIRTLSFIFIKACRDIFDEPRVSIEHSLSKGLYVEVHKKDLLTEDEVRKIKIRMKELIDLDIEIKRELISLERANEIFRNEKFNGKIRLLKYINKDFLHIYNLDGLYDTFYGYLAPSTGCIKMFDLKFYNPGVIIQYPRQHEGYVIPEYIKQEKLAKIYKESEEWGEILDVAYVGALNDKIINGTIDDIIRISEALHEKKVAYIADEICNNEDIRIILIAGPSSSGKTTFAQRLGIQLRVNGKKTVSISLDNYFVNREDTPKDENGNYDFESIDAIDIEKFNSDLLKLMDGKEVEIPIFNFKTGKREYRGNRLKIDKSHYIIIEGIHGLNDRLTCSIPHNQKYKIYISALTQLNVDSHNRIPTTDTRLIRRMVRDNKYRGNSALRTLELWESVRRGEEKYIFPYQEEANVMFNSALVYELAVLKKYAEPLLKDISKDSYYYKEAKRLLKFLLYFKDIKDEDVIPNTSILREFIGGSCFRKE